MKKVYTFICILLVFLILSPAALAAVHTGFSTEPLSAADTATFLRSVKLTPLSEEPKRRPIACFDASDERIAIGCGDSGNKTVCVYTTEGVFQYGWRFPCSGSFGVELDGENLILYFARSDVAASVNPTGTIESLAKIQNTIDNNAYWNHHVHAITREVGGIRYTLKNNLGFFGLFASTYSQLTATGPDGEERLLYDVRAEQLAKSAAVFVLIAVLVAVAVVVIVKEFGKLKRRESAIENCN